MSADNPRNPYAPPAVEVSDIKPEGPGGPSPFNRLYTPGQVALATFLGSFIAGTWFYAQNLVTLGKPDLKWKALLAGAGVMLVTIGLAFVLPEGTPNILMPAISCIVARQLTDMHFGKIISAHIEAGGEIGSWWRVVGVSVLFALALVVLIAIVMVLFFTRYVPAA